MTAEIAVLNRTAVALAADSASTSLQASGLSKIFNTADKLFHLDGRSAIGVMVYGNSSFMAVPWETIIKRYRVSSTSTGQAFATVAAAADAFLSFLSSPGLFSDAHLEAWHRQHASELAGEAFGVYQKEKQGSAAVTLDSAISALLANVSAWPLLGGLSNADVDAYVAQSTAVLDNAINQAFATDLPSDATRQMLRQIIARANLTVPRLGDPSVSGIVLAGFGEDELFPGLWSCQIRTVLPSRILQATAAENEPLSMPMTAMIRPFAQGDMVYSFLYGIDPTLRTTIDKGIADVINKFGDLLATTSGLTGGPLAAFQTTAATTANSLNQNFRDQIAQYCQNKHVDPVLGAIGMLPKDQLALMAETLVSLTSFKRKMSRDAETVGGDVDVAVISKGDGFIWVKRKHYFPPELNLRYIQKVRDEG